MKFIHIADVHLGAEPDKGYPWSKRRAEEIWRTFREVLHVAEQEQADLLFIAGDLFHRQPLLRELKEVNYLFGKLSRTQVVLIAGNHDYLQEGSTYQKFQWEENVIFLNGRECECVEFSDLQTIVYGFSYYDREIREPLYHQIQANQGRAGAQCHILLAHGGDEKHIPIDKRQLAAAGFDYVALGHIHKPQFLVEGRIAYAGALEPLEIGDTGVHGYIMGQYENGRLETEFVSFACREYVETDVYSECGSTDFSMQEQIEQLICTRGEQNIYRIHIQGYRDPEIRYQTEQYRRLGNVLDVVDETEPDYDFEQLWKLHAQDAVGRYIEKLWDQDSAAPVNETARQALYYGLSAMLGSGERR